MGDFINKLRLRDMAESYLEFLLSVLTSRFFCNKPFITWNPLMRRKKTKRWVRKIRIMYYKNCSFVKYNHTFHSCIVFHTELNWKYGLKIFAIFPEMNILGAGHTQLKTKQRVLSQRLT